MFCKKCGNEIKDGEKFCNKCGEPVEGAPAEESKPQSKTQPKTKLGLTVGLMAAIIFFCGLSSYAAILLIVLGGYVLLAEENVFLRKSAIKALAVACCFMFLSFALGFLASFIVNLLGLIGTGAATANGVFNMISLAVKVLRAVLFILLGVYALNCKTIKLPLIDNLIDKYVK